MITFPNTPKTYIDFWKTLASKSRDIAHDANGSKQFVLINKSADPFGGKWDLSEFKDGVTTKIRMLFKEGNYCFALVNLDTENNPTVGLHNIRTLQCAYLILTKISPNDLNERDKAFDATFDVGQQMMNWFMEYLNLSRGKFSNFKYGTEHVIDNEGNIGTAFIFDYNIREGVCYDASRFDDFKPENS